MATGDAAVLQSQTAKPFFRTADRFSRASCAEETASTKEVVRDIFRNYQDICFF